MTEREPELVTPAKEEETPASPTQVVKPEPVDAKSQDEKKGLPPLLRRVVRTLLGVLILFLLGFLAAMILLYTPAQDELKQLRAELQQANEKVTRLSSVEGDLTGAQDKIKTLQADLNKSVLEIKLLRVISNVHQAQLALTEKDSTSAQLYLKEMPKTLEELGALLGDEYKELNKDLQSRMKQVLGELSKDSFAAKSDLKVIEKKILLLEDTLFKSP